MNTILKTRQIITPIETIECGVIIWDQNGRISFCGESQKATHLDGKILEYQSAIAVPGFIDIHVHGGNGVEFGLGDVMPGLITYAKWVARFGVTGFLLTISGPSAEFIANALRQYTPLLSQEFDGAQPLGFHLEGPFLNPQKHGAFNPDWLRQPTLEEMKTYLSIAGAWIRQVSLAPELPGAGDLARFLHKEKITVALAHSATDYETAANALNGDFTHVTHTFNAQSPFHHRKPGVVGAVLTSQSATAELIADTVHVHPAAMRVLMKCVGVDRVVLITDAMPGAGLPDGDYSLLDQQVVVKHGRAYLPDGTIAGSTATMDICVRNMVQEGCQPLSNTVKMASFNPARVIGCEDQIGILTAGKQADITLLDQDLRVLATLRDGKLVFEKAS